MGVQQAGEVWYGMVWYGRVPLRMTAEHALLRGAPPGLYQHAEGEHPDDGALGHQPRVDEVDRGLHAGRPVPVLACHVGQASQAQGAAHQGWGTVG